jgi:outer membrane protein assembly factor BamB
VSNRRCRTALASLGLLAAIGVGVADSAAASDWRQFHAGPSRLGVSNEHTFTRRNVGRLEVKWYRGTGPTLEGINSSPAIANGVVYVGSDDGRLHAFGTGGGRLWSRWVGAQVRSSPAVAGGFVYIGSDAGNLQARKVAHGELAWEKHLGGKVSAPPLVADDRVFVGSRGGMFFAFRARSGKKIWSHRTWSVWDSASYRRGTVYVGSDRGRVYAFDAATGRLRWQTDVWGRVRSTPAVTKDLVYVGTDQGRLYALNRRTGRPVWNSVALAPGDGYVRCAPAVADGRVYVSLGLITVPMDGKVRAFDKRTGREVWKAELADYSTSSPAYVNGILFVGSFDHRLYAISAATGKELWTSGWARKGGFFLRGLSASPAIANGRIFVGVRDGRLYSLGLR